MIVDKKFYKADFDQIITHPEFGQYVDMLLERAMIRKNEVDDPDIDPESYSDIEAVAQHVMDVNEDAFKALS